MNARTMFLGLLTAAALCAVAPEARADHSGKITNWVHDPAAGFAQAHREGKPIMIFFTAEW
jgi:hypothetical protein